MRSRKTRYRGVTFASRYEAQLAEYFDNQGIYWEYEPIKIPWQPTIRQYKPDFKVVLPSGESFYLEAKGYFDGSARSKMTLVKEQHPELDIRLVFMDKNKLVCSSSSKSKTYKEWADRYNFDIFEVPLTSKPKRRKNAKPSA